MAIREWWAGDSTERFWMEITNRDVLGEDLRAPLSGQQNREVWHYSLVSHTRPGDVVFHWHTALHERPAVVGWSTVLGPLREEDHEWVPHAGSANNVGVARPNWVMPLGGIHYLDIPVSLTEIEALRGEVLGVRDALEMEHGRPSYFPFTQYGKRQIRAAQAYLTKLPRALVELLDRAGRLELLSGDDLVTEVPATLPDIPALGQGFLRDTARKLAIEQHAIVRSIEHYRALGAVDIEVLGKPYDLRVRLHGEEIHVEVKGSSNHASEVLLTRNEVEHARAYATTHLVVVDEIEWSRNDDGTLSTTGGRLRVWRGWSPSDESLTAMTYSHAMPPS